jgi:hypothetical protein
VTRFKQRNHGEEDLDPLLVFRMVISTGSVERTSILLGYLPKTLRTTAARWSRRGDYALQFALDAGVYLSRSRRAQRLARGLPARPVDKVL